MRCIQTPHKTVRLGRCRFIKTRFIRIASCKFSAILEQTLGKVRQEMFIADYMHFVGAVTSCVLQLIRVIWRLDTVLLKLAASKRARAIFQKLPHSTRSHREIYYNELCRQCALPKPTVNRYLSEFVRAKVVEAGWKKIKFEEAVRNPTRASRRARLIWARVLRVANTAEAREFRRLIRRFR